MFSQCEAWAAAASRAVAEIFFWLLLLFFCILTWKCHANLKNWIFEKLSILIIFVAMHKKNDFKPFGLWIWIFIKSNDRASLTRKWTARILNFVKYFFEKFLKNYSKLYISVKPKNLPEGRHKAEAEGECFASLTILTYLYTFWLTK